MSYRINNLKNNPNIKGLKQGGPFTVVEYQRDLGARPESAMEAYFCSQMGVRKRQLFCDLSQGEVIVQPGAMQWMVGDVSIATDVKGGFDLLGKVFRSSATGDSVVKPRYRGTGVMVLEPTWRHLLLLNVDDWGGSVVMEDGLFLACSASLKQSTAMRNTVTSTVAGKEGLFNLCLSGSGIACLESDLPLEELVSVELNDDVLRIDGSFAIAWSGSLTFTVERATRALVGTAFSGEGLVNVYRGTGRVLMAPMAWPGREAQNRKGDAEPPEPPKA